MAKGALSRTKRRAEFMTENFPADVRACVASGLAELQLGGQGAGAAKSRRSTLRAADDLLQLLGKLGVTLRDFSSNKERSADPIVLKSAKFAGQSQRIPLPDDPLVDALRAEMNEVNGWLRDAVLDCTNATADINSRHLRRVFNNSSFEHGGRLFGGFWQEMGGDERLRTLRIEDRPVASVDFDHLGLVIAYGLVGATPPDGDLYSIPLLSSAKRKGVKQVLNGLLAKEGPMTRFPANTRKFFPLARRFEDDVLRWIERHHAPIVPLFGTAQATTTQNIESRVLMRALLQLKREEIIALPIHDCVVVRADHAERARVVMEEAFQLVMPGAKATADVDYG
jgi:hypothetical protein